MRTTTIMTTLVASNPLCKLSLLLSVVLMGVGCVGDPDEPVGVDEEAFSGYWAFGRGLASNTTLPTPIGAASGMTCFLSRVSGVLNTFQGAPSGVCPSGATC